MKRSVRISILLFLLVLGNLLALSGCTIKAVQLNQRAQLYYDHQRYDEAEQFLVESLEIDYENSASHYLLGKIFALRGKTEKAIYEYSLAVRFSPTMELAQMAYIMALYKDGQVERSVEAAGTYLQYKGGLASDMVRQAENFAEMEMHPHAVVAYKRAQQLEPTNVEPTIQLANYYGRRGERDMEIASLTEALMADPYYPGVARRLGELGQKVDLPDPVLYESRPGVNRELSEIE